MKDNFYGDMPIEDFKKYGYKIVDLISDYLRDIESLPVLPPIEPGDVKSKLPNFPPESGESFDSMIKDVSEFIIPGLTHWNHPGFMAYFNSTGSSPAILAEFLAAAFSVNGMLWKTAPASAELEEVTLNWLRDLIGLPNNLWGIIYDTASVSSMHAIACAREKLTNYNFRQKGMAGRTNTKPLRIYISEHTHSSIEKGALTLGLGLEGIKKIAVNENFEMIPELLKEAISEDRKNNIEPFCVVATIGTTSTTSIDPVKEIGKICTEENIWLHVDAAYAGIAAILPELKHLLNGIEYADSVVVNPHKWMFVPMDLSVLFVKDKEILKRAFSLTAEYLKTSHDDSVTNYMDYGIQLGRRFRSLKLWFVIRYFGKEGIVSRLREHIRLGNVFKDYIDKDKDFERLASVPLSTVCFRAIFPNKSEEETNFLNEKLMENINKTGRILLSHTKLNNKFTIRLVVSGLRTEERHVKEAWELIKLKRAELINSNG